MDSKKSATARGEEEVRLLSCQHGNDQVKQMEETAKAVSEASKF